MNGPVIWKLKNPYTLPMIITLQTDGTVTAEFPALPNCGIGEGTSTDEAILNVAKAIQAILEPFLRAKQDEGGT